MITLELLINFLDKEYLCSFILRIIKKKPDVTKFLVAVSLFAHANGSPGNKLGRQ